MKFGTEQIPNGTGTTKTRDSIPQALFLLLLLSRNGSKNNLQSLSCMRYNLHPTSGAIRRATIPATNITADEEYMTMATVLTTTEAAKIVSQTVKNRTDCDFFFLLKLQN